MYLCRAALLASLFFSLFVVAANADSKSDVLSGVQRCGVIADERSWLDCFYGAAQPMRARLGLPPAPAAQQRLVPPIPNAGVAAFAPQQPVPGSAALNSAARPVTGPPPMPKARRGSVWSGLFGDREKIVTNARMQSYRLDANGKFTAILSDGQVWTQDEGDSSNSRWKQPASRYVINVYSGALGTYNMVVDGDAQLYKVHRVR